MCLLVIVAQTLRVFVGLRSADTDQSPHIVKRKIQQSGSAAESFECF